MDSSKVTIKEVAKKAGVSIATVSRYFSNPASLREKNLKKVEKAVKELNFQPSAYARRLAGGKLNSFGLIIPGYENIFYSYYALEIIRGIATALEKEEIDLHLHVFWNKDTFKTSLIDGIIFADIIGNKDQLKRIKDEGVPIVVINRRMDEEELSYVAIDNFKGSFEATEFLINHGHKRIAHLAGNLEVQCALERLDGYKRALAKNGISAKPEYIKITNFSPREARERLENLFSLSEPPTAIFCCSDEVANEALIVCDEKQIKIPDKVSIIGFDDNPYCPHGNLMLTTVRQPLEKMTSKGAEILQMIIEKELPPQRVVLDTELVIRDTVGFV
ncbi:MAG: LacI family DNA-binding transcriptional regulator [Candidatus Omnitrophota bacterium]|nr:MAG: LacI family DNA-binding transcriptional regulator [Candidatus Omnitrophota bacterium]